MMRAGAASDTVLKGFEPPDVETASDGYAQRFAGPTGEWMLKVQEQSLLRLLRPVSAHTVLDVGGGHGQLTGPLVARGYHVTVLGSDRSCQQRIKPLVDAGQCRFMVGSALSLPYPAQAFDVVVSVRLLPHLDNWERAIAEMTRVAHYAVIVDYPTTRSLNCLTPVLFGMKKKLEGNTRTYRMFREQEVVDAFAAHQWRCQGRVAQFFWPMVLHRVLKAPAVSSGLEGIAKATTLTRWFGSPVIGLWTRNGKC